jgi:Type IV pilin-like G and H, putative
MSNLLEKNLEKSSRKRNPKRIMVYSAVGAMGIGILFIQKPPSTCACANSGITYSGAYLTLQQAYHLEKQTFATESLSSLGMSDEKGSYLLSKEVTGDRVYVYAIPKEPRELPSDLFGLGLTKAKEKKGSTIVGAVAYDEKRKKTEKVICIAEGSTFDKPPKPVFNGEKFTCPSGFYAR